MPEFPFDRLRRYPDVEADNLQAHDATDRLLLERAAALAAERGIDGREIVVIGDGYGALTLALTHAGFTGVRVHQDLVTGRRALANNARALGLGGTTPDAATLRDTALDGATPADGTPGPNTPETATPATSPDFTEHELDETLLAGARLVLLQLPKALAELEEIADVVARWAAPDVMLLAGGRVKHMTVTQNEVLARCFAEVRPQLAERKSRLLLASGALPVPAEPRFPVRTAHPEYGIDLLAHGGTFAGARIDIGTRVLLDLLDRIPEAAAVVDLGCGTGMLAAAYSRRHPDARVIATDRSAAAVASARATMAANDLTGHVQVVLDDAGSTLPDASADLVLLNPPFHLGASIHTGAATRLFEAAARILRPGGELWTVYNSSLGYRRELTALIGRTEQAHRTPKFTVARSIRR